MFHKKTIIIILTFVFTIGCSSTSEKSKDRTKNKEEYSKNERYYGRFDR